MTAKKRQVTRAFTWKVPGLAASIISAVEVSEAFDPAKPPATIPPLLKTQALWDTGASRSCITVDFAKKLAITSVGTANVVHAGGANQRPTYMVNFTLPNRLRVVGVLVTEMANQKDFDVVIGMDIITEGDFSITNVGGETTMSFRYPSIKEIDYVQQTNRVKYAGIGRNAACPCNSGQKFKNCCGKPTKGQ